MLKLCQLIIKRIKPFVTLERKILPKISVSVKQRFFFKSNFKKSLDKNVVKGKGRRWSTEFHETSRLKDVESLEKKITCSCGSMVNVKLGVTTPCKTNNYKSF